MKLKIEGMTCGHCVAAVEKALRTVPEVREVRVDLEAGEATVEGDAAPEALVAVVRAEGYQARVEAAR